MRSSTPVQRTASLLYRQTRTDRSNRNKETRMIARRLFVATALVSFVLAGRAGAQVLTGSVSGTVRDDSGAVLPGATVRASSSSLIVASVSVMTDGSGMFRFPALSPGEYTLDVDLANFAHYRETGIHVDVQSSIERPVTLRIAGFSESISVAGGSAPDVA